MRACGYFHAMAGDSRPPSPLLPPNLISDCRAGDEKLESHCLFFLPFFLFPDISRYSQHIRSPEGSTLSICGDSQLEKLSLDEGRSSLSATSRDDSSELSFYRRFVEGHAELATRTALSCVLVSRPGLANNTVFPGVTRTAGERCVADGKPKGPTYRPYTIEEYRSLSVPRPDRSLGPDKDELQTKVRACVRGISLHVRIT